MPLFLIEREVPNAGLLTQNQMSEIAQKSKCAMEHLPNYKWHQTYVAGDRLFCVHEAPSSDVIREHSRRGGFPINTITEIVSTFNSSAADSLAPAHV